ncbi:MAG: hypothetical protein ACRCYD_08490, partial [Plesiomonas sp.]
MKLSLIALSLLMLSAHSVIAEEKSPHLATTTSQQNTQDMSDPLAVYSQLGLGISDDGVNVKFGYQYNSGQPQTRAMNIIELKGILGDSLGWSDRAYRDNSIDSARLRNFS